MEIDRDQFMDQGYLILHSFLSADRLETLRASCEEILERQKTVWAKERKPSDPPGGLYETAKQPRVFMSKPGLIDEKTASAVEDFWVSDDTLNVAKQLLCNPDPNVSEMMMMCNPIRNYPGGTGWHRDIHPVDMAPLDALTADFIENGPRYVQWNVPLYDDSVLWVVPGSHRRRNSEQENVQLLENLKQPITGGIPVELKAGDGVVYSNFLLHTGSNYMKNKRRTLHGGHAIFGDYPGFDFNESLAPWASEIFQASVHRTRHLEDVTESILRAIITMDSDSYLAGLETLQPGAGPSGKTVLTILLSKAALHIRLLKDPRFVMTRLARQRMMRSSPGILNWGPEFANRFTDRDSEILWSRFEVLDSNLQDEIEMYEPGFQSGQMHYYFNELPDSVNTESFIASWANVE